MTTISISSHVDALGLRCPEPVQMLHAAVRRLAPGECVELLATDPSTQRDVANFCRFLGHEMISDSHRGDIYSYVIRKKV